MGRGRLAVHGNDDSEEEEDDYLSEEEEESGSGEEFKDPDGEPLKHRPIIKAYDGPIRNPVDYSNSRYKKKEEVYLRNEKTGKVEGPYIIDEVVGADLYQLKKKGGEKYPKNVPGKAILVPVKKKK